MKVGISINKGIIIYQWCENKNIVIRIFRLVCLQLFWIRLAIVGGHIGIQKYLLHKIYNVPQSVLLRYWRYACITFNGYVGARALMFERSYIWALKFMDICQETNLPMPGMGPTLLPTYRGGACMSVASE